MDAAKLVHLPSSSTSEYDKDVWDVCNLGIAAQPATGDRQLNFTSIPQPWLRKAAKQFIRYTLATLSFGSARTRLSALRKFATFLFQFYPLLQSKEIDRALVMQYLSYLNTCGVSSSSRAGLIGGLNSFLSLSARYGWAALPPEPLIFREDYPRPKKQCHDTFQQKCWSNFTNI
ncbi:MAG TPA: hypothetical protein V6C78_32495 [Crinalium sp.]|jgi:hypothetical protein